MQLEDWLVDIETTDNFTDECRTKLVQAKSKGLTHMLITEALTSGKCWEEIKDLLHLLQFRHPHFSKPLYGHSTGERIFSSLHT